MPRIHRVVVVALIGTLTSFATAYAQDENAPADLILTGGRIVILDTTQPRRNFLTPFVHLHMHTIIPLLGRLISGQDDAYEYLPDSSEAFLSAEALAVRMAVAGFKKIAFRRLNFGTIAIHWGLK